MKKIYKVEIVSKFDAESYSVDHDIELMNGLGKDGWELVTTSVMGQIIYGYFIKNVESEEKPSVKI